MNRQERVRKLGEALWDLGHVRGTAMALVDLVVRELGSDYVSQAMIDGIGTGLKRAQDNILEALAYEEEMAVIEPREEIP